MVPLHVCSSSVLLIMPETDIKLDDVELIAEFTKNGLLLHVSANIACGLELRYRSCK